MHSPSDSDEILDILDAASAVILEVYGKDDFNIETKDDHSPLTEADRRANDVIVSRLTNAYPDIPILSEESKQIPYSERMKWRRFWLVDPVDGTKEFIKRNGEFTVNIALIEDGVPVFGGVARPTEGTIYYGGTKGGSFRREPSGDITPLKRGDRPHFSKLDKITVVASRSHLSQEVTDFVEKLRASGKTVEFLSAGSSLKLCLVAEGKADTYPRFGPTMEWDTGAAHAVALGAGYQVNIAATGLPLQYNKKELLNPWFIVE